MQICIMGAGYVGLTFGLWKLKSEKIRKVYFYDINPFVIKRLKLGRPHFYEPGLEEVLKAAIESGRIEFRNFFNSVPHCEEYYICVGTPQKENGDCELQYIHSAVAEIILYVKKPSKVFIRSTVSIGTSRKVQEEFRKAKKDISVIHYPEFLAQGSAFRDLDTERVEFGTDVGKVRYESTEIAKYACNAFLATKISFMNYIAAICEKEGGDIEEVKKIMARDPRIGQMYLNAGLGFGGSCFPKDISYMGFYEKEYLGFDFFSKVLQINDLQPLWVIEKLQKHFTNLEGKKIAIWGLSFKPNTDDVREAPSQKLLEYFTNTLCQVSVYCPLGMEKTRIRFKKKIHYATHKEQALLGADVLVICTEYEEFRQINPQIFPKELIIIDGRNLYSPSVLKELGVQYYSVGR